MLMLAAALLAVFSAVLYGGILGCTLRQNIGVQHRPAILLTQAVVVLALLCGGLAVASPRRISTFSLWEHCNKEGECSNYVDNGFRVAQVLAIIGLGALSLSLIISVLTSFIWKQSVNANVMLLSLLGLGSLALDGAFFCFVVTWFGIFANMDIGYSLALMVFSAAPTSAAAGIVQASVLGHSVDTVDKF